MQIAICDDDNGVCSQLETWILEYQDDNGVKIDIDIYNTAEELFASLKDGKDQGGELMSHRQARKFDMASTFRAA